MEKVNTEPKTVTKWTEAKIGERVHVDNLLAYVGVVHFFQMEKPDGLSFCETPTMTFRCAVNELPYYTRIE